MKKTEYNYFFNEIFSFVMKYLNIKKKDATDSCRGWIAARTWERCTPAVTSPEQRVDKRALEELIDGGKNGNFRMFLTKHFEKSPINVDDFFERLLIIVRKWEIDEKLFQKKSENVDTVIGILSQAFLSRNVYRYSHEYEAAEYTLTYKKDGTIELACDCEIVANTAISAIPIGIAAAYPIPVYAEQGQKVILTEPRGGKKGIAILLEREYAAGEKVKSGYKINLKADDDYSLHYNADRPVRHLTLNVIFESYQNFPYRQRPTRWKMYTEPFDREEPETQKNTVPEDGRLSYVPQNPKIGYKYVIQWYFD